MRPAGLWREHTERVSLRVGEHHPIGIDRLADIDTPGAQCDEPSHFGVLVVGIQGRTGSSHSTTTLNQLLGVSPP